MKKCPFCAEEIKEEAIKCRYCHSDLSKQSLGVLSIHTKVVNFRNPDESGWLNAQDTQAPQAALHFWNELSSLARELDRAMASEGWEIDGLRGPECVSIDSVRNATGYDPVVSAVNAIATGGASLVAQAMGFDKWWPCKLTLSWKKSSEVAKTEQIDLWLDGEKKWVQVSEYRIDEESLGFATEKINEALKNGNCEQALALAQKLKDICEKAPNKDDYRSDIEKIDVAIEQMRKVPPKVSPVGCIAVLGFLVVFVGVVYAICNSIWGHQLSY